MSHSFATLHRESYSQLLGYYENLTDSMRTIRQQVLATVLLGKSDEALSLHAMGPSGSLGALPSESTLLDVGCATGDNLVLMGEMGYQRLTGMDLAQDMIQKAKEKVDAALICADLLDFTPDEPYDLVFAQALVHLFPKAMLPQILSRLLSFTRRRFYFSTTLHDQSKQGLEEKEGVQRYRSRYTLDEILSEARSLLEKDLSLTFHYFLLTDPLGKFWINGVFEKGDPRKEYENKGFLHYRQWITPRTTQELLGEVEAFKNHPPAPDTYLRYDNALGFDRVENFLPFASSRMQTSLEVSSMASFLLGEPAVLLKDKINYKPPGCPPFVPHQDAAAGWQRYGDRLLSCAISFDSSSVDNGALFFAPGAHREGLLSPLKTPLDQATCDRLRWTLLETQPGDALFFDSFAPHYSQANTTSSWRRIAFLTYHPLRFGDHRQAFFQDKRRRQPPLDERVEGEPMVRDAFGKLVYL